MIIRYASYGDSDAATETAAVVPAAIASDSHVDIWPFVKAGVISGLTVWFITRYLLNMKRG